MSVLREILMCVLVLLLLLGGGLIVGFLVLIQAIRDFFFRR
jgi:hypothetical protein